MQSRRWYRVRRPALAALAALQALAVSTYRAEAQDREQARIEAAVADLKWREIGPAVMGGRIADLAVVESNPAIFYVGTATGGLWRTSNHGTRWEPLFDDQPASSIGAVTLAPSNPNVVWVGTGEPQNRQSSPWGNGVYKSMDAGRTWQHMGLAETRHIGRIVVHPRDPDIVYVAAVGHLWGPNPERGVFKTTDGGQTWSKVLFVDDNTGVIDLVMDPGDPQTLFAAAYQRRRTAWGFNGGGPGSGIHRTTDGGASWKRLTEGLPEKDLGRIGLDIYRRDGNLVYAVVEADRSRGFFAPPSSEPRKGGVFRSTDRGETWERLSDHNPRPMYFSLIRVDPSDPERIYLGGINLSASDDGGRNWNEDAADGVHSDHHALWIDPSNSNHLIMGSDGGISVSFDRSKTWRMYDNLPIGQFYEIGVDMRDPYYVCGGLQDNGSWCGPSATHSSRGILNKDWYNIHGGDGFYTQLDPTDHTIVFAESQNGSLSRVDVTTGERKTIRPLAGLRAGDGEEERRYRWNWNSPIVMSSHDPATIYAGANVLLKSADRGYTWEEMSPDLTKQIDRSKLEIMGMLPTDEMLSRHDGVSSYGNLTTISESPLNPNVLYVGTDDGNIQGTRDGGATWTDLTPRVRGLPERTYVSRVVASRASEGTVYATFDGHYNDDYKPYVYVSSDYGRNWRLITAGLPDWSVNIIAEHPRNPNLLFVGNEIGVYFSLDRGNRWMRLKNNLPTVPVDDIAVHPRENDLIIGTHGRSIWILDDITPLGHLSAELLASSAHLFPVRAATSYNRYSPQGWTPGAYRARNLPYGASIRYYLRDSVRAAEPVAGGTNGSSRQGPMRRRRSSERQDEGPKVKLTILDATGATVRELEGVGAAGIHQVVWDLRYPAPYPREEADPRTRRFGGVRGPRVLPGTYTVRLEMADRPTAEVVVELDPRIQISQADLEARQAALMKYYALLKPANDARRAVQRLSEQLRSVQQLVRDADSVPDSLSNEVRDLMRQVRRLGGRLSGGARSGFRLGSGLQNSTSRPTEDQEWQLEQSWKVTTEVVEQLNEIITTRMPALNQQLNELGIRPDPGEAIVLPTKPGG